ncbi:uncharacterized protein LOC143909695 isoform X1 [Arctopsyche grandis]|uniref:uncharacterized protein LOC143909695 isoform X1 n=1 Tax=Arctopsyche grandis TaxID=121162 RepID=UPI00406D9E78
MNKKSLPKCIVSVEPINFSKMDSSKKKPNKSRQTTPVPQEPLPVENAPNDSATKVPEPKPETSNSQESVKTAVNGKSKSKKEKSDSRSQTPAKDKSVSNGVTDVALNSNGTSNGDGNLLVVDETHEVIEDEAVIPNSEQDNDELFPELIYDETSDNECNFDSSSPDFSPVGRSVTRRSQAKVIPTPETPQMLNSKQDTVTEAPSSPVTEQISDNSDRPPSIDTSHDQTMPLKEKVLKMKEIYSLTPRDSPTSDSSSVDKKSKDTDSVKDVEVGETKNEAVSTVVEVTNSKTDTNYSKSRIKISPYRRSSRLSEQYSTIANYSGNNSTQDTDVIEDITSSGTDNTPALDSMEGSSTLNCSEESGQGESKSYSESVRLIKGRKSYRPLRELSLRNLTVQRHKINRPDSENISGHISPNVSSANATLGSETRDTILSDSSPKWTPVGHVVGRKRRQSPCAESSTTTGTESPVLILSEERSEHSDSTQERPSKRQKLLGYISTPLRNLRDKMASSTPIGARETQVHTRLAHKESLIQTDPGTSRSEMEVDRQMPMVSDIVPGRTQEEHKWCLIM